MFFFSYDMEFPVGCDPGVLVPVVFLVLSPGLVLGNLQEDTYLC